MNERTSLDGVYTVVYQQPGVLTTEYKVRANSPEEAVEIASGEGDFVSEDAWEDRGANMPAVVSWHGVLKQESDEVWPSWASRPAPDDGLPRDWEADYQVGPQGGD